MAVRLQMKLGVVAESDRLPDSPDTVVVVEPGIGSVARSKGNLYLLVTGRGNRRLRDATRLVAETIQGEYYYDESAGITVCLEKAIRAANKRLGHGRDRLGVGHQEETGPIGVALAVVRGHELYVATVGPAEAYLVRQAHLLTLPDDHRDHGLPVEELEPGIWRGEMAVGDSLALTSPAVTERLGLDALKDALVTLHPQSAADHLHHLFVTEGGAGSDGVVAIEATEVTSTHKQRTLVPVWPAAPLAGAPDHSPIPLADTVSDGVTAVQAGAGRARSALGSAMSDALDRVLDLLPRRGTRYRRVTTLSSRREGQRRSAIAILGFVGVVAVLGLVIWFGGGTGSDKINRATAGQQALDAARGDLDRVTSNNLVTTDPHQATTLLTAAWHSLDQAATYGVPATSIQPIRAQATSQLDRLYGMIDVTPSTVFSFAKLPKPAHLSALVLGPDGAPYVIDSTTQTVWRIDAAGGVATAILKAGQVVGGTTADTPTLLGVGGPDLLILDKKDTLWRWRPANTKGQGTLSTVSVSDGSTWGSDIRAIGTYIRNANLGLYNLYVVDPSAKQIRRYAPAIDGSGFPGASTNYLTTNQDVTGVTSMYIDGEIFVTNKGSLARYSSGQTGGWSLDKLADTILRPAPTYSLVYSPAGRGLGDLYLYDSRSQRVVMFSKADGTYEREYRLAGGSQLLAGAHGMYVVLGSGGKPATLYWIGEAALYSAPLVAATAPATPPPSPPVSVGPVLSGAPQASHKASPSPTPH